MSRCPHRLLVITAVLSQVKSPYLHGGVNPNRITQSLIAVLAGPQVPFLCTETRELGEELVASFLYQVHLYHWLEANDHGRYLTDNDPSPHHRFVIALHSPGGVAETGLRVCPPEKNA